MIIDKITRKDNEPKLRRALKSLVVLTQLSDMNMTVISEFRRLYDLGEELLRMNQQWRSKYTEERERANAVGANAPSAIQRRAPEIALLDNNAAATSAAASNKAQLETVTPSCRICIHVETCIEYYGGPICLRKFKEA
jgi:hypothetical protein